MDSEKNSSHPAWPTSNLGCIEKELGEIVLSNWSGLGT